MGDRRLVEVEEERNEHGPHWTLIVERSAAGRPGGIVTIRNRSADGSLPEESMTVVLPDLRVFDAAIEWADGGPARGGIGQPKLGGLSARDADRALVKVPKLEAEVAALRALLTRVEGMGRLSVNVAGDALSGYIRGGLAAIEHGARG